MIVGVAFCPHPPALIPELGTGLDVEFGALRAACAAAIRRIGALSPDRLVLIGGGDAPSFWAAAGQGDVSRFGLSRTVRFGAPAATAPALPLSLTVGAWLASQLPNPIVIDAVAVAPAGAALPPAVIAPGAADERTALLVLGDGSARRTEKAPGYVDDRAATFDENVRAALGSGDPAQLAGLDAELGAQLLAAGVPAWRTAGQLVAGQRFDAEVDYADDPFGVGYFVATWIRRA